MSFTRLGLSKSLLEELHKQELTKAYPIQQKAIPAILRGRDVLGIAQTGSGKTLSYVLPTLMNLQELVDVKNRHVNALVLVPTRELAVQVQEVFHTYTKALKKPLKSMAVYGGVSINPQMKALFGVNILIATPGRLLDLIQSNALSLSEIDTLILDEADKMLNLGFKDEMDKILKLLPGSRQNALFSATLNPEVERIHKLLLDQPLVIQIDSEEVDLDLIQQTAYAVEKENKGKLLRFLIKSKEAQQVLVFTSSIHQADHVTNKLKKNGIQAQSIHGKKTQGARTEALKAFKSGDLRVLVATDLLSRGIDIEFLP